MAGGIRDEYAAAVRFPSLPGALCRDRPPDWWFPTTTGTAVITRATRICAACPERAPCRAFARASDIKAGIWGGLLMGYAG